MKWIIDSDICQTVWVISCRDTPKHIHYFTIFRGLCSHSWSNLNCILTDTTVIFLFQVRLSPIPVIQFREEEKSAMEKLNIFIASHKSKSINWFWGTGALWLLVTDKRQQSYTILQQADFLLPMTSFLHILVILLHHYCHLWSPPPQWGGVVNQTNTNWSASFKCFL